MMKRRQFIQGATVSALPIMLNGFSFRAFSRTPLLDLLGQSAVTTGRSLVVIQLSGGTDGLNVVIPYGNPTYYQRRPTINIPAANVLQLNSMMGLHPAMTQLRALYDNAKLCIVQGVGYASPNRSHFRATDIWMTASDSTQTLDTGWLGRDLLYRNPNYPGTLTPAPLALQIGGSPALMLKSQNGGMGITITDPNQFYQLIQGTVGFIEDPPPNTPAGAELLFLRTIEQQAIQYATQIRNAALAATNQTTYPTSTLGQQLAIIARLIAGGLNCPIYMVSQGGYDTHSGQAARLQSLLADLSSSIAAFQTDIGLLNQADNVIGMTFSEFGRRIAENGSAGTDHGTSLPLFLFGSRVVPGFYGADPDFTRVDGTGDFIYNIDYRELYASILGRWFSADATELNTVLLRSFNQLPIINAPTTGVGEEVVTRFKLEQNYPNPFNPTTKIIYNVPVETNVRLTVYDEVGRQVRELFDGVRSPGRHEATFDATGLASGTYFYRIQAGNFVETRKMLLVR
jgi:uncharacterized protein (DUF1501 family)